MVSIAVCDDDKNFVEEISNNLAALSSTGKINCQIQLFYDGEDLARSVKNGVRFDLIFLDIKMNFVDGLKAAEEIREIDKVALIIYVSNYPQYAIEAYSVRPFRFLVKPLELQQLEKCFVEAIDEVLADDTYFRYVDGKQSVKVPTKEIIYFESELRNVKIVLNDDVRIYREKLNHIEKILMQARVEFWRIHQSFLVNRRHIYQIKYSEVKMSNGIVLPISEGRRNHIRQQYLTKITKSMVEEV